MRESERVPSGHDWRNVTYLEPAAKSATLRLQSWRSTWPITPSDVPHQSLPWPLPKNVGAAAGGDTRTLCVGPRDWLLASVGRCAESLLNSLTRTALVEDIAIVDLTDALAVLALRGNIARELLAKGCGLDLHTSLFVPGQCARTRFAKVPVVIDCLESDRFELYVARSYRACLQAWLLDAAQELGELVCRQSSGRQDGLTAHSHPPRGTEPSTSMAIAR